MEAGVPNLAVPQDNILFAFLYDTMRREKMKYFLPGGNFALECILQQGNTYSWSDVVNIRDIWRRFGKGSIDGLKFTSVYQTRILKMMGYSFDLFLLDWIDYNRQRAIQELHDFCGFEYYGRKHLENIFTAFLQLYWLPKKFGVDKRTSHLSSMIASGQMTREEALRELAQPVCDEAMMSEYIAVIKKGLGLSDEDFDRLMAAPIHQHTDYRTDKKAVIIRKILAFGRLFLRK